MKRSTCTLAMAALIAALEGAAAGAYAQQQQPTTTPPARPRDPAANLPSDTGSQTTLPRGAVTGAGQPQGTQRQPDVGSPGGLEPRARREAREAERGAATGAGAAGQTSGDAARETLRRDRRAARQEKG